MQFDVPQRIAQASPDPARVARIRKSFAESAAPVRPLPSNASMMLAAVAVFTALAIVLAAPLGFPGFLAMSTADRVADYTTILLLAAVLSGGLAEQTIPGSRRAIHPGAAVLAAILLLSLTAALRFPEFAMNNFVVRGIPCLRAGLICAIPGGILAWAAMRRGFVTNPAPAGIAGGAFAGLVGVAVLALHCPIFNAGHIIAWHLGALAIASLTGGILARAIVK
jgi:hypothetical protein